MKVTLNVNRVNNNIYFKNKNKQNEEKAKNALMEGAQWFGMGIGVDVLNSKVNLFRSRVKQSIFVNFVLAACASVLAFIHKPDKTVSQDK